MHTNKSFKALLFFTATGLLSSCKPAKETDAGAQYSGGGLAEYVYYKCKSSVRKQKGEFLYETSPFNNTSREVSFQLSNSNFPTLEFFELKKSATDQWNSPDIKIRLGNKSDGSKGIQVTDTYAENLIQLDNSKCELICTGPTLYSDGRCLWTGITEESVIGNMLIDVISTAGLGAVWRLAFAGKNAALLAGKTSPTALAADPAFRSGAELIAKSGTYDDAMVHLAKSIEKTNPLTGTKMIGRGNCANDAATQLVALVLGRWACAIPYPKGQMSYASVNAIVRDLKTLVGIRSSHNGIKNLTEFTETTLARTMKDGDIAMVFSGGKNAGHATLITRIKGRFVHINNQSWPQKFQSVADWEKTWRSTYAKEGALYNVHVISKKLIGYSRRRFF
ncbi:MAG: hypothetical protein RLZZ488_2370 [Pseudomonadota bacterium]|jgi:hypothetical protein